MIHFLLIGAVLFAVELYRNDANALSTIDSIAIDDAVLERLSREAVAQTGRPVSGPDLLGRTRMWIDEEILHREAIRIGLDRADPVVHARLIRNMRFLADAGDPRTDAEMYEEALELGMDRSDIVVRRRLVQQMRFLLEGTALRLAPTDEELRSFVSSRPQRYRIPVRVRLSHVYLSRDRRGDALAADATALRDRLIGEKVEAADARSQGDPFLHPAHLGLQTEAQLAKQLGSEFARGAMSLEPGRWEGPLGSAYGMHVVWVHERQQAREPELESVRRSAASSMQAEANAAALEARLVDLRARYVVDPSSLLTEGS